MKKLLFITIFFGAVSCSNPEDKVIGDKNSKFNSNPDNNLNTPPGPTDPHSQTGTGSRDSSKALDTSIRTDTPVRH